jgi:uncharacterized protein YndB with AHSA1/START domain
MTVLAHQLERTLTIAAPPEAVFRYFTDNDRWAAWWGAGSTIDARPGGRVLVCYPNAVEAVGEVLEIDPPRRIVFSYGYASGAPVPPGGSRVTIELAGTPQGTRLRLTHELDDAAIRDQHVQGWRYQLSVFANVVADHLHADAAALVDRWFAAWSDTNDETRTRELQAIATPDVTMRDRYSCVAGADELTLHVGAAHRFMPGMRMQRDGAVRHCQGVVLAEWKAVGPDGQARGRGTNVFTLAPDGKIGAVTGFWQ